MLNSLRDTFIVFLYLAAFYFMFQSELNVALICLVFVVLFRRKPEIVVVVENPNGEN